MTLPEANKVLFNELRNDPELFRAWKDNIAMAFKDEYAREVYRQSHDHLEGFKTEADIHEIANKAAENFLNLLIKP